MATSTTLTEMIVELLRAYPIDPSERLLQAGLEMEYDVSASRGTIRSVAADLAKAGEIDIAPRKSGDWRYSLNA